MFNPVYITQNSQDELHDWAISSLILNFLRRNKQVKKEEQQFLSKTSFEITDKPENR